jgi:hypothetical protein
LGNQLFGWATALSYSRARKTKLILNISLLHQWGYQLSEFNIPDFVLEDKPDIFARVTGRAPKRLLDFQSTSYFEKKFEFNPDLISKGSFKNLNGYFQSWRYFAEHLDEIREVIRGSSHPKTSNYMNMYSDFQKNDVIAVHVRRGDYVGLENYHGLMQNEYYEQALEIAIKNYPKSKVALFSDDIEVAKKIVNRADYFIDKNELPSPAETMLLMSNAKSIIGANSSFSLWAGYLSQPSNLNIYPDRWFANKKFVIQDLLLPGFRSIGGSG